MQRIFRRIYGTVLPAVALAAALLAPACAQSAPARQQPTLEVAFTYAATISEPVNGPGSGSGSGPRFWMQGGTAQIHGRFYSGWGVVADIAGAHIANIHSSGVGLDLVTATFGPRFTWKPAHARYSLYGQGLAGEAWGINGVFPSPAGANTVANSLAVKAGGGVNLDVAKHLAVRALEADYLRTQLPNSTTNTQNNLTLGAGIVMRFR